MLWTAAVVQVWSLMPTFSLRQCNWQEKCSLLSVAWAQICWQIVVAQRSVALHKTRGVFDSELARVKDGTTVGIGGFVCLLCMCTFVIRYVCSRTLVSELLFWVYDFEYGIVGMKMLHECVSLCVSHNKLGTRNEYRTIPWRWFRRALHLASCRSLTRTPGTSRST